MCRCCLSWCCLSQRILCWAVGSGQRGPECRRSVAHLFRVRCSCLWSLRDRRRCCRRAARQVIQSRRILRARERLTHGLLRADDGMGRVLDTFQQNPRARGRCGGVLGCRIGSERRPRRQWRPSIVRPGRHLSGGRLPAAQMGFRAQRLLGCVGRIALHLQGREPFGRAHPRGFVWCGRLFSRRGLRGRCHIGVRCLRCCGILRPGQRAGWRYCWRLCLRGRDACRRAILRCCARFCRTSGLRLRRAVRCRCLRRLCRIRFGGKLGSCGALRRQGCQHLCEIRWRFTAWDAGAAPL